MADIDYILHDLMMKEASMLTPGSSYTITTKDDVYINLIYSRIDLKGNMRFYDYDGGIHIIHRDDIEGALIVE